VCPVVEFGLLTASIHKIDENVRIDDLTKLTSIYRQFIELYFANFSAA
jgi:succinyl-diaminopimelate desuccinylase